LPAAESLLKSLQRTSAALRFSDMNDDYIKAARIVEET